MLSAHYLIVLGHGTALDRRVGFYERKISVDRNSPCRRMGMVQKAHGPVRTYSPHRAILQRLSEGGCLILKADAALQRDLDRPIQFHQLAKV